MKTTHLICQHLSFKRRDALILHDLSFEVKSGEMCLVMGRNGSGKSTLLKLAAGLYWPDTGHLHFEKHASTDPAYLSHVHYLSHQNGLKPALTVQENIELMLMLERQSGNKKTDEIARTVHLLDELKCPVHQLSFGQKRRLAFSRFFMEERMIWILDEPFTGMDAHHHRYFKEKIQEHAASHGIVMMSTHDPNDFHDHPSHRIALS